MSKIPEFVVIEVGTFSLRKFALIDSILSEKLTRDLSVLTAISILKISTPGEFNLRKEEGFLIDTKNLSFRRIPGHIFDLIRIQRPDIPIFEDYEEFEKFMESISHRVNSKRFGL